MATRTSLNVQHLRERIRVAYLRELWQVYLTEGACCGQCYLGNTADCDVNPLRRAALPTRDEIALKLSAYGECP